jgi:hypothetical protein
MRRLLVLLAGVVGGVATGAPALAHHAFSAEFDANRPVKVQGTVTTVEWVNPHAWIHVDVKGQDGKPVKWMIEASTPNTLYRRGFTRDSLLPGTEIVVEGYRAKDGSNKANGRDLTLPDGRKLFMGSSGTGAPYEEKKK